MKLIQYNVLAGKFGILSTPIVKMKMCTLKPSLSSIQTIKISLRLTMASLGTNITLSFGSKLTPAGQIALSLSQLT